MGICGSSGIRPDTTSILNVNLGNPAGFFCLKPCFYIRLWAYTDTSVLQAGRYKNPEENPFFPEYLPSSAAPNYPFPQVISMILSFFLPPFYLEQIFNLLSIFLDFTP